jgi:hypothetical protein
MLGGRMETFRASHAMVASDVFKIALRNFARELLR